MVFEDYHRATIWRFQPNLLFQFDFCLDQFTKTFTSSPNNVIVRRASPKFKFSLWASIWVVLPSKSVLVVFWNSCVLCYSKRLPIQSHLFSHYLRTSSGWYVRLTYQQQGSIEDEQGRPPPPRLPPAPPSTVEASPSSNLSDQHLVDSHLSAHTLSTLKCKDLGALCLRLLSLHSTLEGWRRRTALQARYSPLCGTAVRAGLGSASWAAWAGRNRRGENRGGECEGEMPPRGAICLQVCNSRSLSVSCQRITLCGQAISLFCEFTDLMHWEPKCVERCLTVGSVKAQKERRVQDLPESNSPTHNKYNDRFCSYSWSYNAQGQRWYGQVCRWKQSWRASLSWGWNWLPLLASPKSSPQPC